MTQEAHAGSVVFMPMSNAQVQAMAAFHVRVGLPSGTGQPPVTEGFMVHTHREIRV